jgi:hypothetical protein
VGGVHLVAAIGADDQKPACALAGKEALEEVQRSRIDPLQIVDKDQEGVLWSGHTAEEAIEEVMDPILVLDAAQLGNLRLRAEDTLQARDDVDEDLAVIAHSLQNGVPPAGEAGLAPRQPVVHQLGEGLLPGGVGSGSLELIELTLDVGAAFGHDVLVHLTDQRRLADTGVSGHQEKLGLGREGTV